MLMFGFLSDYESRQRLCFSNGLLLLQHNELIVFKLCVRVCVCVDAFERAKERAYMCGVWAVVYAMSQHVTAAVSKPLL